MSMRGGHRALAAALQYAPTITVLSGASRAGADDASDSSCSCVDDEASCEHLGTCKSATTRWRCLYAVLPLCKVHAGCRGQPATRPCFDFANADAFIDSTQQRCTDELESVWTDREDGGRPYKTQAKLFCLCIPCFSKDQPVLYLLAHWLADPLRALMHGDEWLPMHGSIGLVQEAQVCMALCVPSSSADRRAHASLFF